MRQTLDIQLSIPIPKDSILIKKVEYNELKKQAEKGEWQTLAWFKEKTKITSSDKLKEKILYPFRNELDVKSGGFVFYPRKSGEPYSFLKSETEEWLEKNFSRIHMR